jgi:hypothetical protein
VSVLSLWCAAVLVGVLAASAVGKLRDPAAFRGAVRAFRLVPVRAAGPCRARRAARRDRDRGAADRPGHPRGGFAAAAAVLAVFAAAVVRVLRRGVPTSCACFGRSAHPVAPRHVVRNLVLIALCAVGAAGAAAGPPSLPGATLALLAAVPVVVAVVVLDDLAAVLGPPPTGPTRTRTPPPAAPTPEGSRYLQ